MKNFRKIGIELALWSIALCLVVLAGLGVYQLRRCANALNESNHIMVGVENGQVPGNPAPQQDFRTAPPAQSF